MKENKYRHMLLVLVHHGLLWVAVQLLQVLGQAGCWCRDRGWWQQVPLLQQVDHSQGLWGAGLEAHGRQGWAQLSRPWATMWLKGGKTISYSDDLFAKLFSHPCLH